MRIICTVNYLDFGPAVQAMMLSDICFFSSFCSIELNHICFFGRRQV